MAWRELLSVAMRYTFALRISSLSSFLSLLSILGLISAIALLVLVLSVMNGFDREMRERILSLVPHVTLHNYRSGGVPATLARQIESFPGVESVRPFSEVQALLLADRRVSSATLLGLDMTGLSPAMRAALPDSAVAALAAGTDGVLLGSGVAGESGFVVGDRLSVLVPDSRGSNTPATAILEVLGILQTGTELDEVLALVPLALASELAGHPGAVGGYQVFTDDVFNAGPLGWELVRELPQGFYATDWTMTHGNLYSAIQLSRQLVTVLLFSIIAVAAFNVVSSLVLVVVDKESDVAILRTLGATPGDVAKIFLLQGAIIGLVGVVLGALLGAGASLIIADVAAGLERWLGFRFLNTDVYPVSFLPTDLRWEDIVLVGGVALSMCLLSALYPARRASRLAPAQVLHQD